METTDVCMSVHQFKKTQKGRMSLVSLNACCSCIMSKKLANVSAPKLSAESEKFPLNTLRAFAIVCVFVFICLFAAVSCQPCAYFILSL